MLRHHVDAGIRALVWPHGQTDVPQGHQFLPAKIHQRHNDKERRRPQSNLDFGDELECRARFGAGQKVRSGHPARTGKIRPDGVSAHPTGLALDRRDKLLVFQASHRRMGTGEETGSLLPDGRAEFQTASCVFLHEKVHSQNPDPLSWVPSRNQLGAQVDRLVEGSSRPRSGVRESHDGRSSRGQAGVRFRRKRARPEIARPREC